MVKNSCTDQRKTSINVDLRSKQTNLPKRLPTRLSQTRVLKQYNVKKTINIKNISAKRNNKNILSTKKIILKIPLKRNPITMKPVNLRKLLDWLPSNASNHWRVIELISKGNCSNILVNLKEIAWRSISMSRSAAVIDLKV